MDRLLRRSKMMLEKNKLETILFDMRLTRHGAHGQRVGGRPHLVGEELLLLRLSGQLPDVDIGAQAPADLRKRCLKKKLILTAALLYIHGCETNC